MSFSIQLSDIIEGDRARNSKKYGDLGPLADSIRSVGTIQPIVLAKRPDGKYDLVAGGRRYRTMRDHLKTQELWHASTMNPERLGFVFREEVSEDVRKEAELDENLHRLDMDWIDNVLLVADVHRAKKDKDTKWGLRQTAELLGKGFGMSNVSYALRVASLLRKGDTDMLACTSMSDAIQLLIKRKEDETLAILQSRTIARASEVKPLFSGPLEGAASFLDTLNMGTTHVPKTLEQLMASTEPKPAQHVNSSIPNNTNGEVRHVIHPQDEPQTPPVNIPLSSMFSCGDCIQGPNALLPTLPDACFDHIVTDIPYGIDMDMFRDDMVQDVKDEHDVDQNVEMMQPFLAQAYRLIKPGGFLVFFYDLDHHEKLQAWATEVGFKVQRWPFIAGKSSACKNQAPQYNTTKNYEVCMFLRKDEKTVLRKVISSSIKLYNFAAEREKYNNPFAKPFELWKDIYDAIAFTGQSVLDPYAGEMSACRAAAMCGLVPFGIEKKDQHFTRGIHHMKEVYTLLHNSNVSFS